MKNSSVLGVTAPPPRPTLGALKLFLLWIALPLVGGLFALDLILWALGVWPYS